MSSGNNRLRLGCRIEYKPGQEGSKAAWFSIRARLIEVPDKLPAQGDLVLTSEQWTLARFAAAQLGVRRPVKVLAGGTEV